MGFLQAYFCHQHEVFLKCQNIGPRLAEVQYSGTSRKLNADGKKIGLQKYHNIPYYLFPASNSIQLLLWACVTCHTKIPKG